MFEQPREQKENREPHQNSERQLDDFLDFVGSLLQLHGEYSETLFVVAQNRLDSKVRPDGSQPFITSIIEDSENLYQIMRQVEQRWPALQTLVTEDRVAGTITYVVRLREGHQLPILDKRQSEIDRLVHLARGNALQGRPYSETLFVSEAGQISEKPRPDGNLPYIDTSLVRSRQDLYDLLHLLEQRYPIFATAIVEDSLNGTISYSIALVEGHMSMQSGDA